MTDIKENTTWQGESREYRFRAWDWEKMSRIFTMQDIWYEWFPSMCYNFPEERDYIKESIVIMQYAWLKDKNWVEIYEGDIYTIEWRTRSKKWDEYKNPYFIVENLYDFYIDQLDREFWYSTDMINVIWNIYQNTELLSEK